MKIARIVVVSLMFLVIGAGLAFADNIGFIDMQKIFMTWEEAKVAQDDFKKQQEEYQELFDKKQEEVEKARKDGKADNKIKKIIEKSEKELEPKKKELLELNQKLTNKLRTKIIIAAKKVAKEYGIDVILDKQVVLVGGFDLSDFIIEKLNSNK